MRLVIDANVVFAALIRRGKTTEIIFHEKSELYAPDKLLEEIYKYKELILRKSSLDEDEFIQVLTRLQKKITMIPQSHFIHYLDLASRISPDVKDSEYIALALELGIPLWTNDKELKKQQLVPVIFTQDLVRYFL